MAVNDNSQPPLSNTPTIAGTSMYLSVVQCNCAMNSRIDALGSMECSYTASTNMHPSQVATNSRWRNSNSNFRLMGSSQY
ncbi:hypothetical protein D3C84_656440 [compost metagenome]